MAVTPLANCEMFCKSVKFIVYIMSSSESSLSVSVNCDVYPTAAHPSQIASDKFEKICIKIHRCIGLPVVENLSVASHGSASRAMLYARDALLRGELEITPKSRTALLCSGIACMRRIHAEVDTHETQQLLYKTLTLLFSLLVLCEQCTGLSEEVFEEVTEEMKRNNQVPKRIDRDDEGTLRAWGSVNLAQSAFPEVTGIHSSWNAALRSDVCVSRAALNEARFCQDENAVKNLRALAVTFFRCSSATIMRSVMTRAVSVGEASSSTSFLTLGTVGILNDANDLQFEKLAALVSAAESEAGQAVLRDMILSFKLPSKLVGVRRTLLLGREPNQEATKYYTDILNAAHEAAMRGAEYSWTSDTDKIHKISAVLAGIAIVLAKTPDLVRKGDAFAGRVTLQFLETRPPRENVTRFGLVPNTEVWCVYSVNASGTPCISASKPGFDGFCEIALLFARSI